MVSSIAGCRQLVVHATVIDLDENQGGCKTPVSCPPVGGACCGTACNAAADKVEGPWLYPPAAGARTVAYALGLQVEAAKPGMFRPPIG